MKARGVVIDSLILNLSEVKHLQRALDCRFYTLQFNMPAAELLEYRSLIKRLDKLADNIKHREFQSRQSFLEEDLPF